MEYKSDSDKCCTAFASFRLAGERVNDLASIFQNGIKPILNDKEKCVNDLLAEKERVCRLIDRAVMFIDNLK